jgi:DNA-binding transcriptional LysR family regulator
LFDRAQTGYTLTESGEAIRLKAEDVEEAVLSVEREAFGRDLRATGKVRVATAEDIGSFVIAPRLAEFHRSYPGIVLELVSSWDVVNLTRREADIVVRTVRPSHGDFIVRQAGVWNCAVYVSRDYAAKRNLKPVQYAACKASLGAAILPCLAADHDPDLIQLLPPERVRSIDLWLVAHQDLSRTARVRAVLDFLADIVPRRTQSSR